MKFLIAGCGSIGRRHLRNLVVLGEKDIVLHRTGHSTLPDADFAGFPVERDLDAALKHRPDAVVISNPTSLHLDVAIPAARAGCHIFLEKPISHNLERIEQLEAALQQGGGQLLVAFMYRFHPALQQIAQLLREGAIGRPLAVRAHHGDYLPGWHPWEDYRRSYAARADLGGGVPLTLCHSLDYLCWLLGDATLLWSCPAKVSDLDIAMDDMVELGLRFNSGAIGSVHLDYFQQPPAVTLDILGTTGSIQWDQSVNQVRLYRAATKAWETFLGPSGFERNDMFLGEMRHFLDVAAGRTAPVCPLADGIRALRLSLAATQRTDCGGRST